MSCKLRKRSTRKNYSETALPTNSSCLKNRYVILLSKTKKSTLSTFFCQKGESLGLEILVWTWPSILSIRPTNIKIGFYLVSFIFFVEWRHLHPCFVRPTHLHAEPLSRKLWQPWDVLIFDGFVGCLWSLWTRLQAAKVVKILLNCTSTPRCHSVQYL